MTCTGTGFPNGDHCCYVDGVECIWLARDLGGRRYACSLRYELGSWEAVHAHPWYAPVQEVWDRVGIESCGTWGPGSGQCCYAETPVEVT